MVGSSNLAKNTTNFGQKHKELENKHEALHKKVERLKKQLQNEEDGLRFNTQQGLIEEKGPAKRHNLYFDSSAKNNLEVEGWYRRDLEKPNWHYYEAKDGVIIHCRKEHILFVVEEEIKEASDE